jgi:hypothetical protein
MVRFVQRLEPFQRHPLSRSDDLRDNKEAPAVSYPMQGQMRFEELYIVELSHSDSRGAFAHTLFQTIAGIYCCVNLS